MITGRQHDPAVHCRVRPTRTASQNLAVNPANPKQIAASGNSPPDPIAGTQRADSTCRPTVAAPGSLNSIVASRRLDRHW